MMSRRSFGAMLGLAATLAATPLAAASVTAPLPTPLERANYERLPSTAEVNAFIRSLAASDPRARVETLGRSAGGRDLLALRIAAAPETGKLTLMIVASQHGQEASGAEAAQAIARDLLQGPLQRILSSLNIVIVPLANPDGRDNNRRVNAADVNLSTDFVLLTQPEARALAGLLRRIAPDVLLDVHESSALKKSSLGNQGYLINFQEQFDIANNPNVDPRIYAFSAEQFLPAVIADVGKRGVNASHYIGEVTNINQTVTHAGLSIRNFRNYAGMRGTVSLLLENQFDPPGQYETPRNIKVRVHKQYIGIEAVLDQAITFQREIRTVVAEARSPAAIKARRNIAFDWQYAADPEHPTIRLPLRRLSTKAPFEKEFKYQPRIVARDVNPLPQAYVLKDRRPLITDILDRHGIRYRRLSPALRVRAPQTAVVVIDRNGKIEPQGSEGQAPPTAGDLWVDVAQTNGLLVPLLLDPRSANSIYRYPPVSMPDQK